METSAQEAKAALRAEARKRLKQFLPGQRQAASSKLCALLAEQTPWKEARCVLLFAPLPDEPDIWPMLAAALGDGKVVGLPRFDEAGNDYVAGRVQDPATELKPGKFGIREPGDHCEQMPLKRLDLILVPGVAFDLRGGRLGRGKGIYDRLLAAASGMSCGVTFDEQIVGEIPVAAHDIRVNCILTPTRWIEF
jgi:5-formyltetrahydrofolate cyclo-ligase